MSAARGVCCRCFACPDGPVAQLGARFHGMEVPYRAAKDSKLLSEGRSGHLAVSSPLFSLSNLAHLSRTRCHKLGTDRIRDGLTQDMVDCQHIGGAKAPVDHIFTRREWLGVPRPPKRNADPWLIEQPAHR